MGSQMCHRLGCLSMEPLAKRPAWWIGDPEEA